MTAHIHAQAMADYAEDALKTDRPWELWEYCHKGSDVWGCFNKNPSWIEDVSYRRKQVLNLDGAVNTKITPFKLLKQIDKEAAKYIKDNGFKKRLNKYQDLSSLFDFSEKAEGFKYWWETHEKLRKAIEENGVNNIKSRNENE